VVPPVATVPPVPVVPPELLLPPVPGEAPPLPAAEVPPVPVEPPVPVVPLDPPPHEAQAAPIARTNRASELKLPDRGREFIGTSPE
jgi:hypothetical protein